MKKKIKSYSLDEVKDKFIGKKGSSKRDLYEQELQMDVIGELIKKTRQDKNLTQEELGKLIGVQKAQISKLESHTGNVTLTFLSKAWEYSLYILMPRSTLFPFIVMSPIGSRSLAVAILFFVTSNAVVQLVMELRQLPQGDCDS